jgi:hypothetical protein
MRKWICTIASVLAVSAAADAQTTPPVRGTVALEATMKTVYKGLQTIVVTTIDGVEHVYTFSKDLIVHGGKGDGVEALEGLRAGSTVVVHYRLEAAAPSATEVDIVGEPGLRITEATVVDISKNRSQITVRWDSGRTETLTLTPNAAAETVQFTPGDDLAKVIVYYSDEKGRKVAHFFRRVGSAGTP